jgi:hypothetical protein
MAKIGAGSPPISFLCDRERRRRWRGRVCSLDRGSRHRTAEVMRSLPPCRVTDLNVIHYGDGTRSPRHPRSRAFVLDNVGLTLPESHAALDLNRKPVSSDLRFGKLGANHLFDGGVAQAAGRCLLGAAGFGGSTRRIGSRCRLAPSRKSSDEGASEENGPHGVRFQSNKRLRDLILHQRAIPGQVGAPAANYFNSIPTVATTSCNHPPTLTPAAGTITEAGKGLAKSRNPARTVQRRDNPHSNPPPKTNKARASVPSMKAPNAASGRGRTASIPWYNLAPKPPSTNGRSLASRPRKK